MRPLPLAVGCTRAHLTALAIAVTSLVCLLVGASGAQAVVVDMNAAGQASVPFNASDQSGYYGVALVPGTRSDLAVAHVATVSPSAPCADPALPADLVLPSAGLCSQGGAVMHSNETFALTWDPNRGYWQTTRNYVEQFLSDVAAGSGTLTSPYAVTTQYSDASGRAQNASVYGGGCIDFGAPGGYTCRFADTSGGGTGSNYPANGCPPSGGNQFYEQLNGSYSPVANGICLTDAQLRGELATMIAQSGMLSRTRAGYTPLVVLLTPPGVETCLDAAGSLCSANGDAPASFCSYHSQVNVGGTEVAYLVQPWTAQWFTKTGCVEPDTPQLPTSGSVDAQTLATDVGAQLVSPLSQAHIAAIVNPALNGWFALDGSEINDNGCVPLADSLDAATVGTGAYLLQREFNNAGLIESDPNALACTPNANLAPKFVVPGSVERGDVVEFDGSTTISSLIVPKAGYAWDFGDGMTAIGPSVVHTYGTAGNYTVTLTVTDRGGNHATLSQTISVLGPSGQPVVPPIGPPTPGSTALQAHLQLMPQGLKSLLRHGVSLRLTSNQAADGFVTLSIPRSAARRAHIKTGRGAMVVVGRGTISGIGNGTVSLHVRLSRTMAKKLGHLRHVAVTVRLTLAGAGGAHVAVDAAGRY
ncbi:MAG TPA: PKD domain-containing protein [Solirubrobacteraceae bacterium]|nr:PKD domain-containing protein [Solirubrobacteraceae bacterium]